MPAWPVNQSTPSASKAAVLRLASRRGRGQREDAYRLACRVDAHDRVQAAVGDPRRAVRADDDAVRRRAGAERDLARSSPRRRVELAERPAALRRVPDAAVRRGRDVVRVGAARARDTRCRARPAAAARAAPPAPGAASRRSGRGRPGGSGLPRAGGRPRPPPARAPHAPRTGARPRRRRRQCCPCAARQRASGGAPRARTAIAPSGPSRARRARSGGSRNPARQRRYRPLLAPAELRAGWPAPRRGPRH